MSAPKLFISYSWSSPEHELWVINLATRLRESGVDAILDKWDLKEGQDSIAFMEQMVNAPDIKKVIMICDKIYVEKTNNRKGGVGTEAQIISPEVYANQEPGKFVAIVRERDDNGKPCVPTYYKSKIYIDLCEYSEENFEQLVRWIFDKQLHIKPEIGNTPTYISDPDGISLGTSALYRRCLDAIKNDKPFAESAFRDYCTTFKDNLERFRLTEANDNHHFHEEVVKSIEQFIPSRNEIVQLFIAIANYKPQTEFIQQIHRLFENLIPFFYFKNPNLVQNGIANRYHVENDNFRFIIDELFLYALAALLKYERFEQTAYLLEHCYFVSGISDERQDPMHDFYLFNHNLPSLEMREAQQNSDSFSLRSDFLRARCNIEGIDLRQLHQADFVAYLRTELYSHQEFGSNWFPHSLLSIGHNGPFEIFAKSSSNAYFERVKILFGIQSKVELKQLLNEFDTGKRTIPSWKHDRYLRDFTFSPSYLLAFDKMCSRS